MLTFTLAISCLTTSNLPWFMDLTFQVPIQYCSLQHWTLLPSPVTSTTGCCFCFGSVSSFFLELFLHGSPVAYWTSTDLGSSSFSVLPIFLPFNSVHGVFKARILKHFAIPFSSGPHFVRTLHYDLSILGGPTWCASQFHWVRQSCGPCDQIGWFSVVVVFSLSALWWRRVRGLLKLPDGRNWPKGKLGLVPMGGAGPCSVNL